MIAKDGKGLEVHGCFEAHDASEPRHNRRLAATCCLAFAAVTALTLVALTVHHQPTVLIQLFSFVPPVSPSVCLEVSLCRFDLSPWLGLFLTHAVTQVLRRQVSLCRFALSPWLGIKNKQTARVGNVLRVAVPAHGTHDVQVPAGTRPEAGEMLNFILPARAGPVLTHQQGTERHAPASVLVTVPVSAHAGDLLQVAVPGFGRRTVRVPPGVHSGEVVEFRVATTSGLMPPLRRESADSAASLYHQPRVSTAPRSPIDLNHAPGLLSLSGLDAIPPAMTAAIRRSRTLRHAVTRASGTPEAGGGGRGGGRQQSLSASDYLFSKRANSLQSLAPARMQQLSDVRKFPAFSQQGPLQAYDGGSDIADSVHGQIAHVYRHQARLSQRNLHMTCMCIHISTCTPTHPPTHIPHSAWWPRPKI